MLTSSGDLTIVQVRQTDSGSYVCVASNGLGEPVRREVELRVTGLYKMTSLSYFSLWFSVLNACFNVVVYLFFVIFAFINFFFEYVWCWRNQLFNSNKLSLLLL